MRMKKSLFFLALILIMVLSAPAAAATLPADGQYSIEVMLSGGTGRARVETPAKLTVSQGKATAVLVWSSPNYDSMTVDGVPYAPINTEGNSVFEIPVLLDEDMAVSARTVAMSQPHDIAYTLRFDSATLRPLSGEESPFPVRTAALAAVPVLLVALVFGIVLARRRSGAGKRKP